MQDPVNHRSGLGLLAGLLAFAVWTGSDVAPASAQSADTLAGTMSQPRQQARTRLAHATHASSTTGAARAAYVGTVGPKPARRYFIEFRARTAASYGHAYLVYGRLNAKGQIVEGHIAGLHPFTESVVPWMIGHVVPVPSETGASDGDSEEEYISARYQIEVSEPEYNRVVAYIKGRQANTPMWHALVYNCNAWVGDVAKFMGLQTPPHILYPELFIKNLRAMNTGAEMSLVPGVQWGLEAPPPPPAMAKGVAIH